MGVCCDSDGVVGEHIQTSQCQHCVVAVSAPHVHFRICIFLTQNSVVDNEPILVLREGVVPEHSDGGGVGRVSVNIKRFTRYCEEYSTRQVKVYTQGNVHSTMNKPSSLVSWEQVTAGPSPTWLIADISNTYFTASWRLAATN